MSRMRQPVPNWPPYDGNFPVAAEFAAPAAVRRAGLKRVSAPTGVVTLIQRFGSAFNLNVQFNRLEYGPTLAV